MNDDAAHLAGEAEASASMQIRATAKAVKPRLAASMVLVDRSGREPKVLLGRRSPALAFLPNKYAFPGGRLEKADRSVSGFGHLSEASREKLARRRRRGFPGPEAFALAAIREIFEETGFLIGKRGEIAGPVPAEWQAFADLGFMPNLSALRFIARAVTPPAFFRRFDTSFFIADINDVTYRLDNCVNETTELVELVWLPFMEAAKLDVPVITAMILYELAAHTSAGFATHLPVPYFYERNRRWIREEL